MCSLVRHWRGLPRRSANRTTHRLALIKQQPGNSLRCRKCLADLAGNPLGSGIRGDGWAMAKTGG